MNTKPQEPKQTTAAKLLIAAAVVLYAILFCIIRG
jgi:hypothetical protein